MSFRKMFLRELPGPVWKCFFCGKNISEGLCVHHHLVEKRRDRLVVELVSAHRSCHSTHHAPREINSIQRQMISESMSLVVDSRQRDSKGRFV